MKANILKRVLKVFFTYILLLTLTLQSFYRSVLTMDYYFNLPEYLAKCINKDQPQLQCDGQCILMQKMEDAEKQESKTNIIPDGFNNLYVHKDFATFSLPALDLAVEKTLVSPYLIDYTFSFHHSIFRPPVS